MKIIKKFPMLILVVIFLISCRTSTNKDYPTNNLEKKIEDNPNSEKKRMEIKFSCGEDGISEYLDDCLLYTSPSPRDRQKSRMPSSA